MPDLIEVEIDSVRVSLTNQQRIVVLKARDQDLFLPIWIGPFEAEAITIALQEVEVARPQTHDLLHKLFQLFNAKLEKVIISSIKDDVYYATLLVEDEGKTLQVDARPSDAIALALRAHVPLWVEKAVMDEAAIKPEEEQPEDMPTPSAPGDKPTPKARAKTDKRLSVFEEYLKKRSGGKPPSSDAGDGSKDEQDPDKSRDN